MVDLYGDNWHRFPTYVLRLEINIRIWFTSVGGRRETDGRQKKSISHFLAVQLFLPPSPSAWVENVQRWKLKIQRIFDFFSCAVINSADFFLLEMRWITAKIFPPWKKISLVTWWASDNWLGSFLWPKKGRIKFFNVFFFEQNLGRKEEKVDLCHVTY